MEKGPVFGLNIGELLTIYDRDSRSWKMSECLFTGDYARYSGPLRKSGMMRNGRIYEQATWVRRTGGKESGLWPTPTTQEVESECELNERGRRIQKTGDGSRSLNLARKVKFPTPHSNCHTGPGKRGENLQTAVMWPTPRAANPGSRPNGKGGKILAEEVKKSMWTTPQQRDWKGKSQRGADPENRDCLPNAVMNYPTPVASGKLNGGTRDFQILQNLADCGQITEDERRSMSAGNGGQLNPQFVEWLMGYPLNYTDTRVDLRLSLTIGWTDCADSETRLSLK